MEKKQKPTNVSNKILDLKLKTIFWNFLYYCVIPFILYGIYYIFVQYKHLIPIEVKLKTVDVEKKLTYWVYTRSPDTYYLKHVYVVLDRFGFEQGTNESDWDLLWAHDYPFRTLYTNLKSLKRHQKVNHFPGCGYITNKVDLSTSENQYIPLAFRIPNDITALFDYASENPTKLFVQKSNAHRGIQVRNISQLDLSNEETFVQEFIDKPFLVDGFKFDIGIYTVITSVDPLRIYVYKADVLFRFCPKKYYPFDSEDLDKYVVGDDYLPIWKVPSMKYYYTELGFSMKDSFDAFVLSKGKDPYKMWNTAYEAIKEVALQKEKQIRESSQKFGNGRNFFELVRVDFTLDEDLNVYLMEANMSPNLSSAHFPPNQLLYEQVLYNLFSLLGVGHRTRRNSLKPRKPISKDESIGKSFQVTEKTAVRRTELEDIGLKNNLTTNKVKITAVEKFANEEAAFASTSKKSRDQTKFVRDTQRQEAVRTTVSEDVDLNKNLLPRNKKEQEMEVADKNLVVLPKLCSECEDCFRVECQLCKPCFSPDIRQILVDSYLEHQNKMDYLRIFPPPISQNMTMKDYTLRNQLLIRWFQGKCEIDLTWCN